MGFVREDAMVALQAAQYNPDLAVEFLMNVRSYFLLDRVFLIWKEWKEWEAVKKWLNRKNKKIL
jgi:hypothetical protein